LLLRRCFVAGISFRTLVSCQTETRAQPCCILFFVFQGQDVARIACVGDAAGAYISDNLCFTQNTPYKTQRDMLNHAHRTRPKYGIGCRGQARVCDMMVSGAANHDGYWFCSVPMHCLLSVVSTLIDFDYIHVCDWASHAFLLMTS
jgi:hypothetical protein